MLLQTLGSAEAGQKSLRPPPETAVDAVPDIAPPAAAERPAPRTQAATGARTRNPKNKARKKDVEIGKLGDKTPAAPTGSLIAPGRSDSIGSFGQVTEGGVAVYSRS